MDPEIIQQVKAGLHPSPDPEIIEAVEDAMRRLGPNLSDIIHQRYFEGLTTAEIAARNEIDEKKAVALIYEGKRRLRLLLADFVERRWQVKTGRLCRICRHPQRQRIEEILVEYNGSCSWTVMNERLQRVVGERFNPPQILKAHLRHMENKKRSSRNE